jgi:3-oxoacyl-[acyl-carrier protein] reductase
MTDTVAGQRKVALVTGASSGIGAACAELLAERGCDVAVNYNTNGPGAEAVAARCRARGLQAAAFKADVSKDAECRRLVADTLARFGRIDILVNNAGTTKVVPGAPLEALDDADFDRLFQVNVRSAFMMSRAAAEALKSANGTIVVISSHSGFSGYGSSMVYAATKGALNTLTIGLARKLAPEIRVNAVCPGFVATDWMKKARGLDDAALAAFREQVRRAAPLKRVVTAGDVAEAVVFFALSASAISGQLLVIDAGTHLNTTEYGVAAAAAAKAPDQS